MPRRITPVSAPAGSPAARLPWGRTALWLVAAAGVFPANLPVAAALFITDFTPLKGEAGTQVTINGTGFDTAVRVEFLDALADFVAVSSTRIVATVPNDGKTGSLRITPGSGSAVTSAGAFTVAPRITGFSPDRGAVGSSVNITGANFEGVTNVTFGGTNAAFTSSAPTLIIATVPAGASTGQLQVRTPGGSAVSTNSFTVTGPGPIIDGFDQSVGAPGTTAVIRGVNFRNVQWVRFGSSNAVYTVPAETQISATVPGLANPSVDSLAPITVATSAGTNTSATNFRITNKPVIDSVSPLLGKVGDSVVINGMNLGNVTGVGFNGKAATVPPLPPPTQISTTVPAGATTGRITATNAFGVGTNAVNFVVTAAPYINDFSPTNGPPGTDVVVNGSNFTNGVTAVKFNGVPAASVTVVGPTQLHAFVPGTATTGPITVSSGAGTNSSLRSFTVTGTGPFITDFSPGSGPRGTAVIISGFNLLSATAVKFNGASAGFLAVADTQIFATNPPSGTTGPITVTSSGGTATSSVFYYVPPRLTGFSPSSAVAGTPVVISGTNFTGALAVKFSGVSAPMTAISSNQITAVLPTNAQSGPVTVVAPAGTIISTNRFLVLPRIDSFAPTLGPAGTVVTVNGTGFFNVTNVTFNNSSAAYTVLSSTQLTATVPPAATTGRIRVATADGTATSATDFIVTTWSDLILRLSSSPEPVLPGQSLTYTIVVTNAGPSIQTGVVVTNTLPPEVAFVSADSTAGTCSQAGGTVTCVLGILTNGHSATLSILVNAPASMGVLTDQALVTAQEPDLNPANNAATITSTVVTDQARSLRIQLLSDPERALVSWPVSAVPFQLQSATNVPAATTNWLAVPTAPANVGGRYQVTNVVQSPARFYRLQRP